MSKFVICPCCGRWLEVQDIGFYTYAFPISLNMRDAVMQTNTQDHLQQYYSNISNISLKPEDYYDNSLHQCILNKENN